MNKPTKDIEQREQSIVSMILFNFLPYWPILAISMGICLLGAFAYLKVSKPTYEASASLLIKDEKKGTDDSRMIETLNVFGTKKIVENEIEVMQSRALMKEVVRNLGLYAPINMEKEINSSDAYTYSPIKIEARDPDNLKETSKIYFRYDATKKNVSFDNQSYPMDTWVTTPYGELKFIKNPKQKHHTTNKLYFSLAPSKSVVNGLAMKLNVTAANKLSSVVTLQYRDEVPERAEDILNELISSYNRAGINDKNALAENTLHFIEERLSHVKFELDSVDKQIQLFRSQQGAVNLSEQGTLFLRNVGENDQHASVISMQMAVLNQVQKFVNSGQSKANIVPSNLGIEDPILSQLLTRLSNAELEYEKLKNTTAENSPILISLANEIKGIKPSILESIRIQKINLKARQDQLTETNQKYSKVLQSIPEKERRLLEISRQKTIISDVYDFLLQKKEETAISYASTVPDSRILDVAEASINPVSPKKIIVLGLALFMSVLVTIGYIFAKDFASAKILFRSDIEAMTSTDIVGEIPFSKKDRNSIPSNPYSQQYYQIIASLGLFTQNKSNKKILLTSSIQGEGKSYLCANLGINLSKTQKKVVLIDLDFNKQSLSSSFKNSNKQGLTEFLKSECEAYDIINPTEHENLFIVNAGQRADNYTSLLSNKRIQELFSFLEQSFDFILIDTSPIDPVSDTLILDQLSDLTLYVVRHAYTPKSLFQLQHQKTKIHSSVKTSILFNGIKPRGFIKGLGFGYGYDHTPPATKQAQASVALTNELKQKKAKIKS